MSTLMPGSIDTPIHQHAANYTGRAIKPLEPVLDVERTARAVGSLVRFPRRELIVGNAVRISYLQHKPAPGLRERLAGRHVRRHHFDDRHAEPTPGTLLQPSDAHAEPTGGWKRGRPPTTGRIVLGIGALGLIGTAVANDRIRRAARELVRR